MPKVTPKIRSENSAKNKSFHRLYVIHSKKHLTLPWVQEAIGKGALIVVRPVPWYVKLWWWLRRRVGAVNDQKASKRLEGASKAIYSGPLEAEAETEEED
jgi:hypothetical protein